MKKLLSLFIIVPIIVFGQEEKAIDFSDIKIFDGLIITKSDSILVTGKIVASYENGQLERELISKDGKRDN